MNRLRAYWNGKTFHQQMDMFFGVALVLAIVGGFLVGLAVGLVRGGV